MKVCAIITTYSDRGELCSKVVNSCLNEGVDEVVVCSNNCEPRSLQLIQAMSQKYSNVHLIKLSDNEGLAFAINKSFDFIKTQLRVDHLLILDDDNSLNKNCLDSLKSNYIFLKDSFREQEVVLYAYRGDIWPEDRFCVKNGVIKRIYPNNYCGFHFSSFMTNRIIKIFNKKRDQVNYPICRVEFGPYGGMFIERESFEKMGKLREDFFVYCDDHEFSQRMHKNGYLQFLIYCSQIIDIDVTYKSFDRFFSLESSEFKLYYGLRNQIYLSTLYKKNELIYFFNKIIFLSSIYLRALLSIVSKNSNVTSRLSLILRAKKDGENGKLGKTF